MLYDAYERRFRKLFTFAKFILKYRIIFITITGIVFSLFTGYFSLKGAVFKMEVPDSFTFGEQIKIDSKTIFSTIKYDYRAKGGENWQSNPPLRVGEYEVRITTEKAFGIIHHKIVDFKIVPRTVELELNSPYTIYGEQPIVTADLYQGDYIDYAYFNYDNLLTTKAMATIDKIVVKDLHGNDVTSSYHFEKNQLEVLFTPKPIRLELVDADKIYDGSILASDEFIIIEGELLEQHELRVVAYGNQLYPGTSLNTVLQAQVFYQGVDVTQNYLISTQDGQLTVTQRPITLRSGDQTKTYDGTPLFQNDFDIIQGSLLEGHSIKVSKLTEKIDVGTYDNVLKFVVIDNKGNDVTSFYIISYDFGSLEILPSPIEIGSSSSEKVYDGEAFFYPIVYLNHGFMNENHEIQVMDYASIVDVGTIENEVIIRVIDDQGVDISSNYKITYHYGDITVTPRLVVVAPLSVTKIYDGTPLTSNQFEIIQGEIVNGDQLEIATQGQQIHVGKSSNTIQEIHVWRDQIDISKNYTFTFEKGSLEVIPRPLVIAPLEASKMYDGTPLTSNDVKIIDGNLVLDHQIEIKTLGSQTDVGISLNEIFEANVYELEEDVSNNYQITCELSLLEVFPRFILVKTASDEKAYDGLPLYNKNLEVSEGSTVLDHRFNVIGYSEIINVGTVENVLFFDILDENGNSVIHNYIVVNKYGTLEIVPREITIKTESEQEVYDNTHLVNFNYQITEGSLINGHSSNVISAYGIIDVGKIDNRLEIGIINQDSEDVSHNYHITYDYGQLEILPRIIKVKTFSAEKPYDGTPLFNLNYDIIEGSFVSDHFLHIMDYATITDVGKTDNNLEFVVLNANHNSVSHNYEIISEYGVLEVTPHEITIQTGSAQKEYDGSGLSDESLIVSEGILASDHEIHVIGSTEITMIGVTENQLSIQILDENGLDVTSEYVISFDYGLLSVNPVILEISTPSAEKSYDGIALSRKDWEITHGSLLEGHELNVEVSGEITEIGEESNTFTYEILDENGNDVSNYYAVVENFGTLEVTTNKIELVIISESDSKSYDGTPLINHNWSIKEGQILENHTLEVIVTGEITEIGKIENSFSFTIRDENGDDVTQSIYEIETFPGILKVFGEDENGENEPRGNEISSVGWTPQDGNTVLFKIFSEISDQVYLRDLSYGDYNKSGWELPVIYNSPHNINPLSFPYLAMGDSIPSVLIEIQTIMSGLSYYLPYYAVDGFYDNINDVYLNHKYGIGYTVNHIPITNVQYDQYSLENTSYEIMEKEYRTFVYNTYLQLPLDTKMSLLEIASKNGLNADSVSIITDVKNYIQNAAKYNLNFKQIPSNVDFAIYFLEHSREGICQHFAMSATVMYRALGIPARYVTGFTQHTKANTWVDVTPMQAHAWVEIYVDGFGWIPIEVTAGGPEGQGGGSQEGSGAGSSGCSCNQLNIIDITSGNASKYYDGLPLVNKNYAIEGSLRPGHSLIVDIMGSITLVGEVANEFTAYIMDENGEDVSSQYTLRMNFGSLVVVPDNQKPIIELQVYNSKYIYNDIVYKHANEDYWIPSHNLPEGYSISLEILGETRLTERVITKIDRTTIKIFNENMMDVTNQFNIVFYDGSIEVLKRHLAIKIYETQKYYDGEPLTSDNLYILQGSLVEGHRIEAKTGGSIINVGVTNNYIYQLTIFNEVGMDVTKNYHVLRYNSELIILAN